MTDTYMARTLRALSVAAKDGLPKTVEPHHSLIRDLGFDSLKISLLSLALETEFGCAIMLDEWIGSHKDPSDLTVASLCDFLREAVPDEHATSHD